MYHDSNEINHVERQELSVLVNPCHSFDSVETYFSTTGISVFFPDGDIICNL